MTRFEDDQEAQFAMSRSPEQIRISKRFPFQGSDSSNEFEGQAARFAYKVFDNSDNIMAENDNGLELVLRETPTRQQLKVLFFEDSRRIPRVLFQRFNAEGKQIKREKFVLSAIEIRDLMLFLSVIRSPSLPLDDDEFGISLTAAAALEVLADDRESARLLEDMKPALAEMFRSDVTAPEMIAYARRRSQLDRFNAMLTDDAAFEAESAKLEEQGRRHGNELTWQVFFEDNPWIFGTGLAPQFLRRTCTSFFMNCEDAVHIYTIAGDGRFTGLQSFVRHRDRLELSEGGFDRSRATHHAYEAIVAESVAYAAKHGLEAVGYGGIWNDTKNRYTKKTGREPVYLLQLYPSTLQYRQFGTSCLPWDSASTSAAASPVQAPKRRSSPANHESLQASTDGHGAGEALLYTGRIAVSTLGLLVGGSGWQVLWRADR